MEIVELVENNMLDYAGAVNQSRAIPDARTGLKPIHRKILYEMYVDKIKSSGKYKKCAYMVGQIIARFSEHGDAATYDALIRLGQDWIQSYPFIDIHGNAGSQFGDQQAAMRYVEAKLSPIAEEGMLQGLDKENVDWIPNFTNEEMEPATLPAIFPGLFCLPNQGMGYATACHFVTYNLQEVADYIIQTMKGETSQTIYPDFASGGAIINPQILESIQKTGKGSVVVDATYKIEGNKIIVTEIPFNVMFDDIYEQIVELCKKEELSFITNLINNSGGGKLELIIEIGNGVNPQDAMNVILDKTKLRNSYPVNQVALVDGQVELLSFSRMVEIYVNHNTACIRREHEFDYDKATSRIEILEGLLKATASINKVVSLIQNSTDKAQASQRLIQELAVNENQAKAILDMRLSSLCSLDGIKLENELEEKKKIAKFCNEVVQSEEKQKEILIERLSSLAKKYGKPRKTQVVQKDIVKTTKAKSKKEEIPQDIVVTFDGNYIKAIPVAQYRAKKNNTLLSEFKTTTVDLIYCFSSLGKVYRITAKDIGLCGNADKGKAIAAILKIEQGEIIRTCLSNKIDKKYPYLTFVTKGGMVKRSEKSLYFGTTRNLNGIKAIGLADGDSVLFVKETNGDVISIMTHNKYCLSFKLDEIRVTGKTAKGMIGIKLADGDYVNGMAINNLPKGSIVQKRAGKGKRIC